MNLEFHPGATVTFDEKGENLLQRVRPFKPATGTAPKTFVPNLHPTVRLTEKDIAGPIRRESIHPLNWNVTEIVFEDSGGSWTLGELECNELDKMAEAMAKLPGFKGHVSRKYIRSTMLDWLGEKQRDRTTITLTEYLSARASREVKVFEAWFPISSLHVESGFSLGKVSLKPMTQEFMDAVLETASEGATEEEKAKARSRFEARRTRQQGLAAAVLSFEAERSYALDAGLEVTDMTIALLRVLHPANMHPGALLHCRPLGRENIESFEALFIGESGRYIGSQGQMFSPYPSPWQLSDAMVINLRPEGLDSLNELLSISERTRFQQDLIDALLTYSKNNISREPADKLMAILAALEPLLLRDHAEPLQYNLGDRMAFMLGTTMDERLSISRLVKDVYAMRSRFVHHGESLNDLELLQTFMRYSWRLFVGLLRDHSKFQDRQGLLDALDRRKFS